MFVKRAQPVSLGLLLSFVAAVSIGCGGSTAPEGARVEPAQSATPKAEARAPRYLWTNTVLLLELASNGEYRIVLPDDFGYSLWDSGRFRDDGGDILLCSDYHFRSIETPNLFISMNELSRFRKLPALKDALVGLLDRDPAREFPQETVTGLPEAAKLLTWWPRDIREGRTISRDELGDLVDELGRYVVAADVNLLRLRHMTSGTATFFAEDHHTAALRGFEAAARRGEVGSGVWLPMTEVEFLENLRLPAPPSGEHPSSFIATLKDLSDLRGTRVEARCGF